MTFDIDKMKVAVADGVSPVCASCLHYWRARYEGLPNHSCVSPGPCGSPIAGYGFPHYDGPMKGALDRWCFMCGSPSDLVVVVEGELEKPVGICLMHALVARDLEAVAVSPDKPVSHRKVYIRTSEGLSLLSQYARPKSAKQTLLQSIQETGELLAAGKKL